MHVAVKLFEHNQKAYRSAVDMLEREGKVAIVHPTGTGKSFIAFQLALDQEEREFSGLVPASIFMQLSWKVWHAAAGRTSCPM